MKKTLNITIGGRIFAIEEDAYQKLHTYLEAVKKTFTSYPEAAEIITDMEDRLADQFQAMHENVGSNLVTLLNIEKVITIMGTPEDLQEESSEKTTVNQTSFSNSKDSSEKQEIASRRLFRNPDDKIIFGICSGIAAYFGIDVVFVRIAFILLTFVGGLGIFLYLILALIVPEAKTPTEKMEMRGQPITIAGIVKTVEQEFTDEKNKERIEKVKNFAHETSDSVRKVISEKKPQAMSVFKLIIRFPFEIMMMALRFLKNKIFPICVRIAGVLVFLGTMLGLFTITSGLCIFIFNIDSPYLNFPIKDLMSGSLYYFLLIFGYLILLIPLILTTLLALTMLRYKNSFPKTFTLSLVSAWIIVGVFGGAITVSQVPNVIVKAKQHPFFKETTTNYPLKNFNKISVNGPYQVTLRQGKEFAVTIQARGNSLRFIKVEKKGDTLVIYQALSSDPCIGWCGSTSARVEITMPDLKEITSNDSGGDNVYYGEHYINIENMNLDSLKLDLLHQRVIFKDTKVKNLNATLKFSSIRGAGQIKNVNLVAQEAEWDGADLATENIQANLKNHSNALFNTTEQIKVTAADSSEIRYIGTPKITSQIDKSVILQSYADYLKHQTDEERSNEGESTSVE